MAKVAGLKCLGCQCNSGGQRSHMGLGGCLSYDDGYSTSCDDADSICVNGVFSAEDAKANVIESIDDDYVSADEERDSVSLLCDRTLNEMMEANTTACNNGNEKQEHNKQQDDDTVTTDHVNINTNVNEYICGPLVQTNGLFCWRFADEGDSVIHQRARDKRPLITIYVCSKTYVPNFTVLEISGDTNSKALTQAAFSQWKERKPDNLTLPSKSSGSRRAKRLSRRQFPPKHWSRTTIQMFYHWKKDLSRRYRLDSSLPRMLSM